MSARDSGLPTSPPTHPELGPELGPELAPELGPELAQREAPVRIAMTRWVESMVIGLKLCPFATEPWKAGGVRIALSHAANTDDAVKDALDEAFALLEGDIRTTLVTFPDAPTLLDFETFLDVAETVDAILSEAGAAGILQVATFHPNYLFGDEPDPNAIGHYTNRSPYPVLHLIREEDVTRAVDEHPDIDQIPIDNVACLEALGREQVLAMFAALKT